LRYERAVGGAGAGLWTGRGLIDSDRGDYTSLASSLLQAAAHVAAGDRARLEALSLLLLAAAWGNERASCEIRRRSDWEPFWALVGQGFSRGGSV